MIDGKKFSDQPIKPNLRTYDSIQKFKNVNENVIEVVVC